MAKPTHFMQNTCKLLCKAFGILESLVKTHDFFVVVVPEATFLFKSIQSHITYSTKTFISNGNPLEAIGIFFFCHFIELWMKMQCVTSKTTSHQSHHFFLFK